VNKNGKIKSKHNWGNRLYRERISKNIDESSKSGIGLSNFFYLRRKKYSGNIS